MRTLLPYPSYPLSAHVLSNRHLGAQRSHCLMILRALSPLVRTSSAIYRDHPVVRSWRGYEGSLLRYTMSILTEWRRRGLQDNVQDPIGDGADHWGVPREWADTMDRPPLWLGWERLHAANRSTLLQRDEEWYHQFCWDEGPRHMVVWPQRRPSPGDTLIHDDGTTVLVREMMPGDRCACNLDGGGIIYVRIADVERRVWRYARREHD